MFAFILLDKADLSFGHPMFDFRAHTLMESINQLLKPIAYVQVYIHIASALNFLLIIRPSKGVYMKELYFIVVCRFINVYVVCHGCLRAP